MFYDHSHIPNMSLGWTLLKIAGLATWPSFAFTGKTLGADTAVIFVELDFILCHGSEDGTCGCQPVTWVIG